MNELIYLTGKIDFPFFTNEIEYFCSCFDKVHVIAYSDNKMKCDELSRKYGFTYEFVNGLGCRLKASGGLLSWIRRDYVITELREKCRHSIKRRAYVLLYGLYSISVSRIIEKHIKTGNDIYLYSFWLSRPAFAIASLNVNRHYSIKRIVSRTHRYDLYEEENSIGYLPFRKFIAENLDVIYFSSRDTFDYYKNKNYSSNLKQAVRKLSYLGTRCPVFFKHELNKDKIVIGSYCFIRQRKRLDLIIEIIRKIAELGETVRWIHIGNGDYSEDKNLENFIKSLAAERLNQNNVSFRFFDSISDEKINSIYSAENIDYFINMSDSEGIPVATIQALSMGIPSIARNVGGVADAVINDYDGLLIEKDEIDDVSLKALAIRIVEISKNNQRYKVMSNNAIDHWNKVFSAENNVKLLCADIIDSSIIQRIKEGS